MLRVIAGSARRLQLKTLEGMDTRPTQDRIKETLFNVLQQDLYEARFLDLFSGSGAIAIEALSRGASEAVLVETNKKAVAIIEDNLAHTKLADHSRVMNMDACSAIRMLEGKKETFDIIHMDPPYRKEMEAQVLRTLASSSIVAEDTIIVVEAALETDFSYLSALPYEIVKTQEYKTNKHLFLRRK